jgi:hypothetical protein
MVLADIRNILRVLVRDCTGVMTLCGPVGGFADRARRPQNRTKFARLQARKNLMRPILPLR